MTDLSPEQQNVSCAPISESELLAFYRAEIRFESEVVNGRLHALLASQSFLVIAYATAMTGSTKRWGDNMVLLIPPLLAVLGFMLALLAWPGIRAAYAAISKWEAKEHSLHTRCHHLQDFTLATTENDMRDLMRRDKEGARFAMRAPIVFLVTWAVFAAIPFYLYLM